MINDTDTAVRPGSDGPAFDVVVIGFGPVGQTLSILLAQRGHRVAVIEKWGSVYPKPRAVTFDDEAARVLAAAGISDRFPDICERAKTYEWRNATGETLLRFPFRAQGDSGWPEGSMFSQPQLEQVLADHAASFPNITIHRSTEAIQLTQHADRVEVIAHGSLVKHRRLTASYVIGCDGANSFVRQRMDTTVTDLGFFYEWLICDVIEAEPRVWSPDNMQVCDPNRPTTVVSGGPGRRRWEFMRMPGDVAEEFDTDENAWALLAPSGFSKENATLEKRAVYTFQARWVDRWQDGRLFVAGDAAHLMPPFAGQGMASGLRDAANLAWKLDLVLRDVADPEVLHSYSSERSAHVRHAIMTSVELGKVICATDPEVVAARDAHLLAVGPDPRTALPPIPPARLGPGVLQPDPTGAPADAAGLPAVQGRVRTADGQTGLLDAVFGIGFHLLVDGTRVTEASLNDHAAGLVADLEASVVRLVPDSSTDGSPDMTGVVDVAGVMLDSLRESGHAVQVVRPDGYVFGGVADIADLPALLTELAAALHHRGTPVTVVG